MGQDEGQVKKRSSRWKKLWGWTGFGEKKLWDWLQLLSALAIPVVLAVAGFWFTAQQQEQQQEVEAQRVQGTALQSYLDQMNQFMLEEDLRGSEEGSEVRTLARAQTLTVLQRLDPSRKTQVLRFLIEAELIRRIDNKKPIIALNEATLRDVNLHQAPLEGARLPGADLSGANLSEADLPSADLVFARVSGADLSGANLCGANLHYAHLPGADLSGANLCGANLANADLSDANLSHAYLNGANLDQATLSGADLGGADLSDADLSHADLGGAHGVTKERLVAQAKALEGAIMPDGQKMPSELESPEPGAIPAGEYIIDEFEPAFRLVVGEGWEASSRATRPPFILNETGPDEGQLNFSSPRQVFDPSDLSEPKTAPAPDNAEEWASWFQRHPNLDASKSVPVSVGGASGLRIDVTATSTPVNSPHYCGGQPCVPLFPTGGTPIVSFASDVGFKDRFVIVDVAGKPVVVNVSARADEFDEFLPKAQKVLDTVQWEGA